MSEKNILDDLLSAWEETYKKGQLTLWIFFALRDGPKYVERIKQFVEQASAGTITCEEQSLYRSLRKFEHVGVLAYELRPGNRGPERKYYYMTELGEALYTRFVDRNIKLFYTETIKNLL
jgi:DNA-binding PadR family transcriptional regulator